MNASKINIGIVGATGVVGETFLLLMAERDFPAGQVRLFASEASRGVLKKFNNQEIEVEVLKHGCFDGLDIVFFSSGDDISKEWAPHAARAGAIAIDNSAAFRMFPEVLLCVPECNGSLLPKLQVGQTPGQQAQIIANPNCSTIQLVVALQPLVNDFGIRSVRVASYQSVSGAGKLGIEELINQTKIALEGETPEKGSTFPKAIAFDSIPQIGSFQKAGPFAGFCTEEIKIMQETRKILRLEQLKISASTVRVPTLNSHAENVWVTLDRPATSPEVIEACLSKAAGLQIFKTEEGPDYPTQAFASGQDPVFVGRIRRDPIEENSYLLWVVADNLRKGAALNGIQIAETIYGIKR